jgi:3',5'-cyclic AMP phosphodiesterase CpdA
MSMSSRESRREILKGIVKLAGVGGVVFASRLAGAKGGKKKKSDAHEDFFFLQLSDTHWGYSGVSNPKADVTLPSAIEAINAAGAAGAAADFIVFTGDLTHTTDDAAVRRQRLTEFKKLTAKLAVPSLRLLPGEHDAAKDAGAAYQEILGPTRYTFDHKGVHFIALDNVSDPAGAVGDAQIDWLHADLKKTSPDTPVVVLTHRPLFDLYPQWEWATKDGAKVVDVLLPHKNVTVFYGHIHQEHHHETEHIAHHAARSMVFALPAPGSVPKKAPLPWNDSAPFAGLGYRRVDERAADGSLKLTELPVRT